MVEWSGKKYYEKKRQMDLLFYRVYMFAFLCRICSMLFYILLA